MAVPDVFARPHAVAFLRDVIENPDDDASRLVFADWLDENGAAQRAEFIRSQIEREKLPPHSLRYRQMLRREEALREEFEPDEPKLISGSEHAWGTYRRGFVEGVRLEASVFVREAERLCSVAPVRDVELLNLHVPEVWVEELAAVVARRRMRSVRLDATMGDETTSRFVTALQSEALEELDLSHGNAAEATLRALPRAKLPRLRVLRTYGGELGGLLRLLFRPRPCYVLRELALFNLGLVRQDFEALWNWPGLARVEVLNLGLNRLGVREAKSMAADADLRSLRELHLGHGEIGVNGVAALAGCAWLGGVRKLDLSTCLLGPPGVETLVASPHLGEVHELDLSANKVGDDGLRSLAAWPGLRDVAVLKLGRTRISAAGLAELLGSPHLGEPVHLSLRENVFGAAGARLIAGCPALRGLYALDLDKCQLDHKAATALLASPHLGNLVELHAHNNPIGAAMRQRLRERFPEGWF
jgi:uncharacterized protein (TIGR02996 family)